MSWQPCPRCGDGNPWRAVWCEGCGAALKEVMPDAPVVRGDVDAVRAPDLPTPPKAVRLPRADVTPRAYTLETPDA